MWKLSKADVDRIERALTKHEQSCHEHADEVRARYGDCPAFVMLRQEAQETAETRNRVASGRAMALLGF